MKHLLIDGMLLAVGFDLGLLLIRLFGPPEADELSEPPPVRTRAVNPSRR
jgi:hypothetical protein